MLSGSAFIGVAASETQHGGAYRSIQRIARREGDGPPVFAEFTKGADARQWMVEEFLASSHSWLLFLDGDMEFPPHALERLRSHNEPCVSGLYFRRSWSPMMPIWFADDPLFRWPMVPFADRIDAGRLYRLGATGFGCWLIHRMVFERIAPMLKGERYILEDDLDVWPYSLADVLAGREMLRPLRGVKDTIGADLRLGFFVRQAGFTLWGDPAVECGHYLHAPIGLREWNAHGLNRLHDFKEDVEAKAIDNRKAFSNARERAIYGT